MGGTSWIVRFWVEGEDGKPKSTWLAYTIEMRREARVTSWGVQGIFRGAYSTDSITVAGE